jgi:hypothetical protein
MPLDFILTGIPRSGTSLLCRLMDDQRDCVVVNEPAQAVKALAGRAYGQSIADLYSELRLDIIEQRPIANKVLSSHITTDTAVYNRRVPWRPAVDSPNFILGTKNTLVYLCRLSNLRLAMPSAPIFACIRHPRPTISSWKRTFKHLADADVRSLLERRVLDGKGSVVQSKRINAILGISDVRARRAHLWRHLALMLWESRECATVLKYESLTSQPLRTIETILQAIDPGRTSDCPHIQVEVRASSADVLLDAEEDRLIGEICGDVAAKFGY